MPTRVKITNVDTVNKTMTMQAACDCEDEYPPDTMTVGDWEELYEVPKEK